MPPKIPQQIREKFKNYPGREESCPGYIVNSVTNWIMVGTHRRLPGTLIPPYKYRDFVDLLFFKIAILSGMRFLQGSNVDFLHL